MACPQNTRSYTEGVHHVAEGDVEFERLAMPLLPMHHVAEGDVEFERLAMPLLPMRTLSWSNLVDSLAVVRTYRHHHIMITIITIAIIVSYAARTHHQFNR